MRSREAKEGMLKKVVMAMDLVPKWYNFNNKNHLNLLASKVNTSKMEAKGLSDFIDKPLCFTDIQKGTM